MRKRGSIGMDYWLALGPPENWETAFEQGNTWGLTASQKHLWDSLAENDVLLFYVTRPVSGIIGYGTVLAKYRQSHPLWPKEVAEGKVKWPLRFEFSVEYCLARDRWETERTTSDALKRRAGLGFHRIDPELAQQVMSNLQPSSSLGTEEGLSLHESLKSRMVEIGKLQGFVAETEYPVGVGRLDVVWRKLQLSVPTRVFEVQVGGDIYHALAKLKHAFDLWNSSIFIIASRSDLDKAHDLLAGTFHEISGELRTIELGKVDELYRRKKSYLDFEQDLGIH